MIIAERRYDPVALLSTTDLPFLVRLDTGRLLRAADAVAGWQPGPLSNAVVVTRQGDAGPPIHLQPAAVITEEQRASWGDFVVWDRRSGAPAAVSPGPGRRPLRGAGRGSSARG